MTVSVITTCYNTEAYVAQCLDSILASSHKDLDIIVVDDGSTDHTLDVIEKYADESRIKIMSTEHRGRRAALELAHRAAEGDVQCWVDSDDFVHPRAIEQCLAALDDEHRLSYTHRRILIDGQIIPDRRNDIEYSPLRLLVDNMIFHLRMFTTELFNEAGGVGELETAIDWDMNLRMAEHTEPVVVPHMLYGYRVREGRMTGTDRQKKDSVRAVMNTIMRRGLDYDLEIDHDGWHLRRGGYV